MSSPADSISRRSLQTMAGILLVLVLLALFSMVQDARREQLETATVTPVVPAAATPEASPAPEAP